MGFAKLEFDPRICLKEFIDNKAKLNLIRRVKGRKSSKNMLIWGENLASLAALKAGSGTTGTAMSVDTILIDPPYNVGGNQGYKNIWKGKSEKERDWAGDHGEFLDFMEPRIKIGRSLLKDDGIMFVNICDGEYTRLKILMDEVFGANNCLGTLIWNKTGGSPGKYINVIHEYILIYAKDASKAPKLTKAKDSSDTIIDLAKGFKDKKIPYDQAQKEFKDWLKDAKKKKIITAGEAEYKYLHPETFRPFRITASCAQDKPETRCHKKLKHPKTGKSCNVPSKGWKWSEKTLMEMYSHKKYYEGDTFVIAGKISYGKDENCVPGKIKYLDEDQLLTLPSVINLPPPKNRDLPKEIQFSTPKPVGLNKLLLKSINKEDAVILDYFAGSGATAQAVHELNIEDGGTRNYIMIEEMGSTFHNVLLKRCEHFDKKKDFSIYELKEVGIKTEQLFEVFEKYSFDFLSAYHTLDEDILMSAEGMNILGHDKRLDQVVAMTMPQNRDDDHFFEEELAVLKEAIKKSKAKNVLI